MTSIDETLKERGARYGRFEDHAKIAQALKDVMRATPGWARLADDQKQALETIADKQARILNGDPTYHDNWHDIVGYAKLVADRLLPGTADAPRQSAASLTAAVLESTGRKSANGAGGHRAARRSMPDMWDGAVPGVEGLAR